MRPPECDLPPEEAKCLPHKHCAQATSCARWLIPMTQGRPVGDFTLAMLFVQGRCPKHLPAEQHRKQQRRATTAAPTVHDTPAGLA